MILWNKIKEFVDRTYTDADTGRGFLTFVLLLGGFGISLCLIWFILALLSGIPVWAIILDSAVILFCGWVVVKLIIPLAKESFKMINEKERNH